MKSSTHKLANIHAVLSQESEFYNKSNLQSHSETLIKTKSLERHYLDIKQ